jgi:hypothetical protein
MLQKLRLVHAASHGLATASPLPQRVPGIPPASRLPRVLSPVTITRVHHEHPACH